MRISNFTVNENILNLCSEIARLLGRYEGLTGAKPQPKLRRANRIRTIQGSLAIEGNSLSIDQVTAVFEGKRVLGPKKDILEAQNANKVYEAAATFDPFSIKSMLNAHKILMKGLIAEAGRWRSGAVGIFKGSEVTYMAPKAQYVQGMIKELLQYVRKSKTTPLITSSLFHYEFEHIHPFSDGNGRMGRLWQHLLLVRVHPLFEYVPVESIVCGKQAEYYRALEKADKTDDATGFVEFMLGAILEGTKDLLGSMRVEQVTGEDRLAVARENFQQGWFSRKDYQAFFIRLSSSTASRDLRLGVDQNDLERKGDKALARYRFRRTRFEY
jgi:Fic family protein